MCFFFVLFARQFHGKHDCSVWFIMSIKQMINRERYDWHFSLHFIQATIVSRNPQFCRVRCERVEITQQFPQFEQKCIVAILYKAQRIQSCSRRWKCLVVPRFSPWIVAFFVGKPRNIFSWSLIRNRSRQPDTLYLRKQIRSTWPLLWKLFCLWCSAINAPTIFHTLKVRWGRLV